MKREQLDRGWEFTRFSEDMIEQEKETVNLPHDFTIATEVRIDAPGGKSTGYYKGGVGRYEKYLDIPEAWKGKKILVELDGAHRNTEVGLNGNFVTFHPYGYSPFQADITPFVEYGKKNRLHITVNNSAEPNSRWYAGTGIYRHVDLLTAPMVHLAPWSIFAYTERIEGETAFVTVEVTVENCTDSDCIRSIEVRMMEEGGEQISAAAQTVLFIPAGNKKSGKVHLVVHNVKVWDIEKPELYKITAEILGEAEMQDSDSTLFGVRTITIDKENGLQLNGRTLKIKGGCVHHDNGILGAASFYDSEFRKMELHKINGYNGIRCAHNPPSRDMLCACDHLGLLVVNEAFDMWRMGKKVNDYHLDFETWWKQDMELFMTRDRNHPSIFMWSIGNEIVERNGLSDGFRLSQEIAEHARSLDATRPITSAVPVTFNGLNDMEMEKMQAAWAKMANQGYTSVQNLENEYGESIWADHTEAYFSPLDVAGYNYLENRYENDHNAYPDRIICGLESYPKNIDQVWEEVEKCPYVIGDFTWTSYDYIGEAGLGKNVYMTAEEANSCDPMQSIPVSFPWRLSFDADFDLCGNDRPQLHYRKIVWGSNETYIAVHNPANMGKTERMGCWAWEECYPEWNYSGYEGKPVKLEVYSRADEVEVFINEKSIGRKSAGKANRFRAVFETCYEAGSVTAVSYCNGEELSRKNLETAGKAVRLNVEAEPLRRGYVAADGQSLVFIRAEIQDQFGRRVPFDDRKIKVKVSGAGTLAAFGTGRPETIENYTKGEFTSYLGRTLAIVRAGYEAGEVVVSFSAEGLEENTIYSVAIQDGV